jgi:hypothetical protein
LVDWLVDCAGITTSSGAILSACQYFGFFFREYCVGANLSRVKGPVPTGVVLVNLVGSLIDDQMCWGTITWLASTPTNGTLGCLKVTVTLLPDALAPEICDQMPLESRAGNFFSRS